MIYLLSLGSTENDLLLTPNEEEKVLHGRTEEEAARAGILLMREGNIATFLNNILPYYDIVWYCYSRMNNATCCWEED